MPVVEPKARRWPGILLIIVGVVVLALFASWPMLQPDKPFTRIGAFFGLISVVALLFRDAISRFGAGSGEPVRWRRWARNLAPLIVVFFVPLTIISALYQLVDSDSKFDAREQERILAQEKQEHLDPDKFIEYQTSWWENAYKVDGGGLRVHLKQQMAHNKQVDDRLAQFWYPDLLIVNCGTNEACPCPADYPHQVEYRQRVGNNWNLNAGIKGHKGAEIVSDSINLCWRKGGP